MASTMHPDAVKRMRNSARTHGIHRRDLRNPNSLGYTPAQAKTDVRHVVKKLAKTKLARKPKSLASQALKAAMRKPDDTALQAVRGHLPHRQNRKIADVGNRHSEKSAQSAGPAPIPDRPRKREHGDTYTKRDTKKRKVISKHV